MNRLILLISSLLWTSVLFAQVDTHLLLELKKAEAYFTQISYEYQDFENDLKKRSEDQQITYIDELVSTLSKEVEMRLKDHSMVEKGMVRKLFSDIKEEAKILTRTHGIAISATFLTIELTEIPMKAVALSLGSPIVVVLYEVLQPGLTIPAATIAIQSVVKNYKMKKIFANNANFKAWKKSKKSAKKKFGLNKDKGIFTELEGSYYKISKSSFITRLFQKIGLKKKRLDYYTLLNFLKKNNALNERINLFMSQKNIPGQLKAELILGELSENHSLKELFKDRFEKNHFDLENDPLDDALVHWIEKVLEAKSKEELRSLFETIPETISPVIFMELWENVLMEEFFENNNLFKLKYYRYLSKNLLKVITLLRKEAYATRKLKSWDESSRSLIRDYFLNPNF